MMRSPYTLIRLAALGGFAPLPGPQRRRLGRWMRGWGEHRLLDAADAAVVSYGKSGRTWLRLMLSRFYQQRFGLPEGSFLEFDNLSRRHPGVPTLFFTHGNYLRDYTGHRDSVAEDFRAKPVVLLVRDPRDVAVSQYFQWSQRMSPHKKWLNEYPAHGEDVALWDFVAGHPAGLERAIRFLNVWGEAVSRLARVRVVRYEDLRAEPAPTLHGILDFLGARPDEAGVRDAVDYAAFDNMRRLEESRQVGASGRRLVPGRRGDRDSYKVRRGKVGGWRDYFDEEQERRLDQRVQDALRPGFGYRGDEDRAAAAPAALASEEVRR